MILGLCTGSSNAPALAAAGWSFIEENAQSFLQAQALPDAWNRPQNAALPVSSLNCFIPGNIPVVGPSADENAWTPYVERALSRAGEAGVRTIVFGSGVARHIPEGFARTKAAAQVDHFLRVAGTFAEAHNVVIVIEPLNRGECNFINTVTEAVDIARRVQSPNVKCLVDSYHFWLEDESLSALEAAMPWIRHVHVADKEGRVPPGESGKSDYGPFFRVLKQGGYDGPIAVECRDFSVPEHGRRVFDYLTSQWHAA